MNRDDPRPRNRHSRETSPTCKCYAQGALDHPYAKNVLTFYMPSIILASLMSLSPIVLMAMLEWEGVASKSDRDRQPVGCCGAVPRAASASSLRPWSL